MRESRTYTGDFVLRSFIATNLQCKALGLDISYICEVRCLNPSETALGLDHV